MVATSQDLAGDRARTLRISITGQCNLSCFYCRPLGRARELFEVKMPIQPSDVTKMVRIAGELGVTRVVIGGGEPLLRKDAAAFVKSAYAHKAITDVRLVTNGTYLKAFADELRKNGLRKVDINFDTLHYRKYHEIITRRDDLFRVLDGIEKVEKLNFPEIRVNVILLAGINDEEIVDFARMTKDHPIHLRFLEYRPVVATGDPYAERPRLTVLEAKRRIDGFQKLIPDPALDGDIPLPTFRFADGDGQISFLSEMEVAKEMATPSLLFNAEGVLSNELVPNRPQPLLAELRRDAKQDRLKTWVENLMQLHRQQPRKKPTAQKRPLPTVAVGARLQKTRQAAARR